MPDMAVSLLNIGLVDAKSIDPEQGVKSVLCCMSKKQKQIGSNMDGLTIHQNGLLTSVRAPDI